MGERYQRPGWFTKHVFNRIVAGLTRLGISVAGSRILEVRGRKSGEWRRTPVNLLEFEGRRYLVAPRGNTQWARNLRASSEGRLLVSRRAEPFTGVEVPDEEKVRRADFAYVNDGTVEELDSFVRDIVQRLTS